MPNSTARRATSATVAFGASWSRSTRLLTAVFFVCSITILAICYPPSPFFYGTTALVIFALALAYWYAPTGYRIDTAAVQVERRAGPFPIPFDLLRSARLMEPPELAETTWRWPSVGGLFGFYGTFETPALGRHRWYASRDENLVVLQTTRGPVVISPDDPATFVREVNQRLRMRI